MESKARRRHVPAFGEWNYYYSSASASPDGPRDLARSGAAAVEWWCSPEPEACSDVWFRYSPPPHNPAPAPKKTAVRRPAEKPHCGGAAGKGRSVVPAAAAARAPGKAASRRVVRPVDEDLYHVPPPDDDFVPSVRRPRRKRAAGRSLWMGCFGGLGCVA